MPVAEVFDAAARYRRQLEEAEEAAQARLVAIYRRMADDLLIQLDDLLRQMRAAEMLGQTFSPSWAYRADRLARLHAQTMGVLTQYAPEAAAEIARAQSQARMLGKAYAVASAQAAAPPAAAGGDLLTGLFTEGLEEVAQNLLGFASDGSPLADVLRDAAGPHADDVVSTMVRGVAQGVGPRVMARRIRDSIEGGAARALTISRTETMRAYRETSRQVWEKNTDVVEGWVWHSAMGDRTCAVCWAMHGTEHEVSERLASHPNCRCAMLPLTPRWDGLGAPDVAETRAHVRSGPKEFADLDEATQRKVLGPSKYHHYKEGNLTLPDLVGEGWDRRWGGYRYERPLRDLGLPRKPSPRPRPKPKPEPEKPTRPPTVSPEPPTPVPEPTPDLMPDTPGEEWRRELDEVLARKPADFDTPLGLEDATHEWKGNREFWMPGERMKAHHEWVQEVGEKADEIIAKRLDAKGLKHPDVLKAEADRALEASTKAKVAVADLEDQAGLDALRKALEEEGLWDEGIAGRWDAWSADAGPASTWMRMKAETQNFRRQGWDEERTKALQDILLGQGDAFSPYYGILTDRDLAVVVAGKAGEVKKARALRLAAQDRAVDARKRLNDARKKWAVEYRREWGDLLASMRRTSGHVDARPIQDVISNWDEETFGGLAEVFDGLNDFTPADWVDEMEAIKVQAPRGQRGHWIQRDRLLSTGERAPSIPGESDWLQTTSHEWQHALESSVPLIKRMEWVHHADRTSKWSPKEGRYVKPERIGRLSTLTGQRGYGDHEVAQKDLYQNAYIGRVYNHHPGGNWELLSMGMEDLLSGGHEIHADHALRRLILGIYLGV